MNTQRHNGAPRRHLRRQRVSIAPRETSARERPSAEESAGLPEPRSDRLSEHVGVQRWMYQRPAVALGVALALGILIGFWVKRR